MGKSKSNRATGVWPIRGRRHQAWLRRVASSRRVGGITRSNSTARRRGCGRRFSWGPALAAHEKSGSCTTASDLPRPTTTSGHTDRHLPHPVGGSGEFLWDDSRGCWVSTQGEVRYPRRRARPKFDATLSCPQHNRRHRWTMADLDRPVRWVAWFAGMDMCMHMCMDMCMCM